MIKQCNASNYRQLQIGVLLNFDLMYNARKDFAAERFLLA